MSPSPLSGLLPAVHSIGARLSALWFDARFGAFLRAAGIPVHIGPLAQAPDGPLYRLQLTSDAGPIELIVSAPDQPALSMTADLAMDDRLRRLAAHALLAPWLGPLARWGVGGVQALGVAPVERSPALAGAVWCVVRGADGRDTRLAATQWPAAVQLALQRHLRGATSPRLRHGALMVTGAATLGVRGVTLKTLRSLARGDVLVAPWLASADGLAVTVRFGVLRGRSLTARGCLSGHVLTIEEGPTMSDLNTDPLPDAALEEALESLGELDIPVHFEVETVAVPLADLESIEPGYVIELTTPVAAAAIRLVAYGQTIGHAELVAVGDRLGARITRMVARDEPRLDA